MGQTAKILHNYVGSVWSRTKYPPGDVSSPHVLLGPNRIYLPYIHFDLVETQPKPEASTLLIEAYSKSKDVDDIVVTNACVLSSIARTGAYQYTF